MIRYRLGDSEATRRACAAATVRGAASLAPIVMAVLLLRRLGWAPSASYGLVAGVLVVLIVTRALVGYARMRRKLRALTVTVGEKDIRVETSGDGYSIPRERVAVRATQRYAGGSSRGGPWIGAGGEGPSCALRSARWWSWGFSSCRLCWRISWRGRG